MTPDAVLTAFFVIVTGVIGLLIGSFLNVVVYRVPQGVSIVSPPSACPHCSARIRSRDNVPVFSWLVLRARCRDCSAPISARYPIVELLTGVCFALAALAFVPRVPGDAMSAAYFAGAHSAGTQFAGVLELIAVLYLVAISIALTLIDLDTHRLPNAIVIPSYLVGGAIYVAAAVVGSNYDSLCRAAIGMAALFLLYAVMAFAYPGGMGLGDVKLAGVLGLYLGWSGWGSLAVGALAAFILGGLFGLILIIIRKANARSGIPFGPWMIAGAWIGIVFGGAMFTGYLSLFGLAVA